MGQHLHHHAPVLGVDLNPLDFMGFGAIFSFSFVASLHCAFMCSPLVCAALGDRAKISRAGIWLYNGGRMVSYALTGMALGAGSQAFFQMRPTWGSYLSKGLGIFIIVIALSKFWEILFSRSLLSLPKQGIRSFSDTLLKSVHKLPPLARDFGLGLATVALPCMTLTPALTTAAASGSSLKGLLYMLAFALGTLPIMLGATYVPVLIYRRVSESTARLFVAIFLLMAGIITYARH